MTQILKITLLSCVISTFFACSGCHSPVKKTIADNQIEREARMLKICWLIPQLGETLAKGIPCDDGEIALLDKGRPLVVMNDPKFYKETKIAVDAWNASVGFTLFTISVEYNEPADVYIFDGGYHPRRDGITLFGILDGKSQRGIFIHTLSERLPEVIIHELGHALGLRHAADPEAIMFRGIYERKKQKISKDSADIIKFYYAPVK